MNNELRCVAMAALLSGCAGSLIPPRQESFQGLNLSPESPSFPELKLAVVNSVNTRNSMKLLHHWAMSASYDGQVAVDRLSLVFKRNFKEVVQVESAQEAAKAGADLVALLDDYISIGGFKTKEDVRVVFMSLDNQKLDEISSSFEKVAAWSPRTDVERCAAEREKRLEPALRRSKALAEFARARPRPAPAKPSSARGLDSDVDRPGYSRPQRADDFALVVGIEKYSALPDADFAERDAAAVRAHLVALGYPERNVVSLAGPKATRTGIEKYLESWLPLNVREDSRVFFYFSGHGAPDPKSGRAFLVPWDGDPKFLENTGYPIARLYDKLNALKAKQVMVAMDACFSGAGGRSVLAAGTRPLVMQLDPGLDKLGKLAVISAAGGDEVTGTDNSQGHGVFTYYLLRGLNERSGDTTLRSLFDYLLPKVQDAARRDNREQTPRLMPPAADARP